MAHGLLAWRAWRVWRAERRRTAEVTSAALGAFAILAMATVFSGIAGIQEVWVAIMLAGVIFAFIRPALRRLATESAR